MIKEWEELNAKATLGVARAVDDFVLTREGAGLGDPSQELFVGNTKISRYTIFSKATDAALDAFLRNNSEALLSLVKAAKNMRDCKGRYHTEQATKRVFDALAKLEGK